MAYYRGVHRDQFDGGFYEHENCTPTGVANGSRCATGGKVDHSGSYVRALVKRSEEQNPETPGWSLNDADLACSRLNIGFLIVHGSFTDALSYSNDGHGVLLQGKSSVFTEGCSAAFDGGHAIYLHPDRLAPDLRLIGDSICSSWRFEREYRLRQYVNELYGEDHVRFGVFTTKVPQDIPEDPIGDTDVKITTIKGEDWKAIGGNGVFRAAPIRSQTPNERVPDGTVIRSIAEATTPDGNNWRMTERNGKPAWMIRSDWQPLVQGGDPATDAKLTDYIKRT